uniref:Uncharacterized protein n=1 Tax=Molossus molossus TaxID=27622 RepID=A0A7J8E2X7_MOLMO|nr:hypothetical protein HJG59_009071 [Molossus molossus]
MPKGPSGKLSCPGALTWAWTWTGPADRCVLHTEQRSHLEMERWSSGAASSSWVTPTPPAHALFSSSCVDRRGSAPTPRCRPASGRKQSDLALWELRQASDGQECITLNTQLRKPESFREELGGQDVDLVHSRTNEVIPGAAAGDLWDRLQI